MMDYESTLELNLHSVLMMCELWMKQDFSKGSAEQWRI